jgi:hypothetical protein
MNGLNGVEMAVVAAAVLGAGIGYCGCAVLAARKLREIRNRTWSQAALFYTRKAAEECRD